MLSWSPHNKTLKPQADFQFLLFLTSILRLLLLCTEVLASDFSRQNVQERKNLFIVFAPVRERTPAANRMVLLVVQQLRTTHHHQKITLLASTFLSVCACACFSFLLCPPSPSTVKYYVRSWARAVANLQSRNGQQQQQHRHHSHLSLSPPRSITPSASKHNKKERARGSVNHELPWTRTTRKKKKQEIPRSTKIKIRPRARESREKKSDKKRLANNSENQACLLVS